MNTAQITQALKSVQPGPRANPEVYNHWRVTIAQFAADLMCEDEDFNSTKFYLSCGVLEDYI